MFSADLIPCTLTFPLISLALIADPNASANAPAISTFPTAFVRVIAFLSFRLLSPTCSNWRLENVVNTCLERIRAEKQCVAAHGVCVRVSERVLVFAEDFDVGANQN